MESFQDNDRLFNNADSFAMVFDEAWKKFAIEDKSLEAMPKPQRLEKILLSLKDHPFVKASPKKAKEVAEFRMRLLKLV